MKTDPFEVFETYLAIKSHFTTKSYNYNKYKGKVRTSKTTFYKRKDRGMFSKLGRNLDLEECRDFFIANFSSGKEFTPLNILDEESFKCYNSWKLRQSDLSAFVLRDIIRIRESNFTVTELIKPKFELPKIIQLYIQGIIVPETLVLVNYAFDLSEKNHDKLDDALFKKYQLLIEKYSTFVVADWNFLLSKLLEEMEKMPKKRQENQKYD